MAKVDGKKSSAPIWILYSICVLLTAALVAVCLWLFVFSKTANGTKANEDETVDVVWQQLDAAALAATVDGVYADTVSGGALTIKDDALYLSTALKKDGAAVPMTFALAKPSVSFAQKYETTEEIAQLTSAVLKDVDEDTLVDYVDHLEDYGMTVLKSTYADVDVDGKKEFVYVMCGLADAWAKDADRQDVMRPLCNQTVCLYIDIEGDAAVAHALWLYDNVSDVQTVSWKDGLLQVEYTNAAGNALEKSMFVCDYATTVADYTTDSQARQRIESQYIAYLNNQGYSDITVKFADVSDGKGEELLCTYRGTDSYRTVVLAVQGGKLCQLYEMNDADGALFVVEQDGIEYLLEYVQTRENERAWKHAYALFRLNDRGEITVKEGNETTVYENEDNVKSEAFVKAIQPYLPPQGIVCHDPYDVPAVMESFHQKPTVQGDKNYLRISNCATSKEGVITLKDEGSWLNFRTGPSKDLSNQLLNPADPKSEIRPMHGTNVTVIRPHNTGDAENPIWLEMTIKINGKAYTGYSAQQFVRIDGIRHVKVGDRFTITTETDQTGLSWTCSDTSVATVDANGTLTAHRAGMVLVTVTAANGLEDSCLIMVNATGEGDAR